MTDSESDDPTLFMALTSEDGTPIAAPLFAALKVSARLEERLNSLSKLCADQHIESMTVLELKPPIYWELRNDPGLEVFDGETRWHVVGNTHHAELWGRRRALDGSFSPIQCLAKTVEVKLRILKSVRKKPGVMEFVDDPCHGELFGQSFMLTVLERLFELRLFDAGTG